MTEVADPPADEVTVEQARAGIRPGLIYGLLPLALLGVLMAVLFRVDPLASMRADVPPIEDLTFDRVVLSEEPSTIRLTVTNGGPETVTVAQILVDQSFWRFGITPSSIIEPLRSATIDLDYPWVTGEPFEIEILTSTGLTFQHAIHVAKATPAGDAATLADVALIGLFVGLLPVLIGLCWYPFVGRVRRRTVQFLLALTAGVLVFLAVDATVEAIELVPTVPTAFQGFGIFIVAVAVSSAVLIVVAAWRRRRSGQEALALATAIALGVGLHNLGEGMAIGAAFALGEVALTTLLVIGFALHNSTEGLAIVTPLSRSRPSLGGLVLLGVLAGTPTILGTWVGALAYSPVLAISFLGFGVGAIGQVVAELGRLIGRDEGLGQPRVVSGFAAGLIVMYVTAVIIAG